MRSLSLQLQHSSSFFIARAPEDRAEGGREIRKNKRKQRRVDREGLQRTRSFLPLKYKPLYSEFRVLFSTLQSPSVLLFFAHKNMEEWGWV